jgi:hypothetical protein
MRNFDCVPPLTQFNVQISILSSFINYYAHMYEFLPQSLYGTRSYTFDNLKGPSCKTSTERTSIKHHKMASHSYSSPQSSHHQQAANTKIQAWLAPINHLPSNNTTNHIMPHCCPCWATSCMRHVWAIPSPSSPQVLQNPGAAWPPAAQRQSLESPS